MLGSNSGCSHRYRTGEHEPRLIGRPVCSSRSLLIRRVGRQPSVWHGDDVWKVDRPVGRSRDRTSSEEKWNVRLGPGNRSPGVKITGRSSTVRPAAAARPRSRGAMAIQTQAHFQGGCLIILGARKSARRKHGRPVRRVDVRTAIRPCLLIATVGVGRRPGPALPKVPHEAGRRSRPPTQEEKECDAAVGRTRPLRYSTILRRGRLLER
jgi:hypothetical protein